MLKELDLATDETDRILLAVALLTAGPFVVKLITKSHRN